MLFNSLEYLLYLPSVFLLYWFVFKSTHLQNAFVVIVSYIFYGWWSYKFLFLIAFTSFCSFVTGLLIEKHSNNKNVPKFICACNIIINVLILGLFKYYNFFVESLADALETIGLSASFSTIELILPVGISFYTFQALSYSIDVYKKKINATRDIVAFFAYVSFFPQLVAGPIERATNLLPQFQNQRKFDALQASDGLRQILWGLLKKIIVADNCASVANNIFANYEVQNGGMLFIGAIMFTFQIYGDFSGYSDIAIGSAKLFGIRLMRNFNCPYFSQNISEFWKRWHISLNKWFVDYIYIPLGGSRNGKAKTIRNTFTVFFLSGLWHGANWTYIVWGLYHALLFIPNLLLKDKGNKVDNKKPHEIMDNAIKIFNTSITFILVVIGWIIFRSATVRDSFDYVAKMIYDFRLTDIHIDNRAVAGIAIMLFVELINRKNEHGLSMNNEAPFIKYRTVRHVIYAVLFLATIVFSGQQSDFIYFQF